MTLPSVIVLLIVSIGCGQHSIPGSTVTAHHQQEQLQLARRFLASGEGDKALAQAYNQSLRVQQSMKEDSARNSTSSPAPTPSPPPPVEPPAKPTDSTQQARAAASPTPTPMPAGGIGGNASTKGSQPPPGALTSAPATPQAFSAPGPAADANVAPGSSSRLRGSQAAAGRLGRFDNCVWEGAEGKVPKPHGAFVGSYQCCNGAFIKGGCGAPDPSD